MRSHNNYQNVQMSGNMSSLFGGNAPTLWKEKCMINAMEDDDCRRLKVRK